MTAPVDVLEVMDAYPDLLDFAACHYEANFKGPGNGGYVPSPHVLAGLAKAAEARADVAELIAADKEYDNALVNVTTINREISERGWVALEYDALSQACTRLARAESRRMAAIAAVSP